MDSGAAALFVARAKAADPRFALKPENRGAVADVCRRLDGIPLAIELAAARIPLLGIDGLRSRLDDRFSVLTAGSRTVLRRHQTLRAALDWSHGLLSQAEQRVYRRLGVFSGGFALEAAQHVAEDEEIDRWDVLEHLGALVDKSLVVVEGDSTLRYRMLETTRMFALERLADAGETQAMSRRHAEAFVASMSQCNDEALDWQNTYQHWEAVKLEMENARAAIAWALECDDEALSIQVAAYCYYPMRNALALAEYLHRALPFRSKLSHKVPLDQAAHLWRCIASAGWISGHPAGLDAAHRAASAYRDLGNDGLLYLSLSYAIASGARNGQVESLRPLLDEAMRIEKPDWAPEVRNILQFAKYRWFSFGLAGSVRKSTRISFIAS
jgi:hypothetical protein